MRAFKTGDMEEIAVIVNQELKWGTEDWKNLHSERIENTAAKQCEGGVEWDEKDCWLKTARPNGWVDQGYSEELKHVFSSFDTGKLGRPIPPPSTVQPDGTLFTTTYPMFTVTTFMSPADDSVVAYPTTTSDPSSL